MSPPLDSLPLIQALVSLMETAADNKFDVFFAGAPLQVTRPYAVCYPDIGIKSPYHRTLVNDGPDELRHQWTYVGDGPEQAAWVADKGSAALLTVIPTVAGRRVWRTVEESVQPMRRDDTSTGLYYVTAQYLTRSDPT